MTHIYTICVDMRDIYTQLDMTYIYTICVDMRDDSYIHNLRRYDSYIYNLHRRLPNPVCCSVLQCVAVCYSVLQRVAIYIAGCTIDTANFIRIRQCVYVRLECIQFTQIWPICIQFTTQVAKATMPISSEFGSVCTTQSIIYVHSLVNRFYQDISLIVRYKYLKSYSEGWFSRIWSSAQDPAVLGFIT